MPKGFVSEGDLNPRARDLRICAIAWPWRWTTAGQRCICVRGPTAPKSQYALLLTSEFALDALAGMRW